jgi:hypothetical protein
MSARPVPPRRRALTAQESVDQLLNLGARAFVAILIMVVGGLVVWIGLPIGWLWVAGRIDGATSSLGEAIGAGLLGVLVSEVGVVFLLGWLSNRLRALHRSQGLPDPGHFTLEVVMVVCAAVAMVAFGAWFLLFAGASPVPLGINP